MTLIELFEICNNRRNYTTVKVEKKKFRRYEVDYKFMEDEENNTLYIFFEPSDGRTDWIVNFSFGRRPYKEMETPYKVHGGFLESFRLVKDALRAKIKETREDGSFKWEKVVSVGYSHGGPLAALCHELVWFERPEIRKDVFGISFDGPRMFAAFKVPAELKERWAQFYVFRNHSDIVTHLPPFFFGFRHVGNKIKIGAGKNPGWIGAHYPERIKEGLEDFIKNGAPDLKEKVVSAFEGIEVSAGVIADYIRNLGSDDVHEKTEEIVENIKEE